MASWYLFVGLRFYFDDIKEIVTGKRKLQFRTLGNTNYQEPQSELNYLDFEITTSESESEPSGSDTIFQEVDALVKRLKKVITDATQRKLVKQEFENHMRLALTAYPLLRDSPYRSSVDELIVSECQKQGSILLSQQEVEALWDEKS
ncbi:hypothetical protein [Flavobacterium sp. AED]|uniref:hypothetical protein n=1 Tax=Flavobacterium sp. AED TaxID=1423323 RepID=UPI001E464BE4|nr:hypothetical protein [Flavobacterium sp. AED]